MALAHQVDHLHGSSRYNGVGDIGGSGRLLVDAGLFKWISKVEKKAKDNGFF